MSDLIEKIRKCANMPCMDMEGNPDPSGYRSGMWITAEDADQILSALETVRGIEGLAAEADLTLNIHPPLVDCDESCEGVRWLVEIDGSGFNGPTLSAVIEAARKQ